MTKSAIALEKMKSLSFFRKHLYEDVLVDLMAVESWDASTSQLIYDNEIYDVASNKWLKSILLVNLGQVFKKPTGVQEASISEDKQTGLIQSA